jgi:ligand-binding sensor domain-containing protein/signal transduction histidine kinase
VLALSLACSCTMCGQAAIADETPVMTPAHSLSSVLLGPAPERPVEFEHISLEEGLAQSSVYCILQDRRGFLWFATEEGLHKYDGYDFTVYRHNPDDPHSLSQNFVWTMLEDRQGRLWIGTNGGGLDRFDRDTGQFIHYPSGPGPNSLSGNFVRAIYEDREGMLWIATNGSGLSRFDPVKEEFTQYHYQPGDPNSLGSEWIWAIYEDQAGELWIGTDGAGLARLDRATGRFAHFQHEPDNPFSLSSNAVRAIYEDRQGVLWIGTDGGGLNRFDRATGRFFHYKNDSGDPQSLSDDVVSTIYEDQAGVLWIGTMGGGLNALNREYTTETGTGKFIRYQNRLDDAHSLSSDFVWSIYEDRMGLLWVGTRGGGVNKYNRFAKPFALYRAVPHDANSLSDSFVWTIYEDRDGILWVGTNAGGLNRLDRKTGQFTHYRSDANDANSLANDVVRVVYEDRAGNLWIGMNDGRIDRFDRSTDRFVHYRADPLPADDSRGDAILAIRETHDGMLWLGLDGGGLNWYDQTTDRFVYYRDKYCADTCLAAEFVRDILEDGDGALWLATLGGGLVKFEPRKKKFVNYPVDDGDAQSLSSNMALSIHQDQAGSLWIGTYGGGLNKFDPLHGSFVHYRESDGLANDVVYGILEDGQGNLWLSTNGGLSSFDPRTETFKNYDVSDGLQSNEFNGGAYFQSPSGEMFFGGINGFNAFFPEQVQENQRIPPVVITALKKFNQTARTDLPDDEQVRLPYQENFLSFEFAALDFTAPQQNQYAYKMENLDRDWVYAGTRRHADYPNLRPGEYIFRVKGSNSDGVWNEEGTALRITITPPFWATWWFRGTILFVLVSVVFGVHRLRARGIEVRSRELEARIEERTLELRREIDQRVQMEEALRQSEMEKAVSAERSRLARDLHDAVSQTLFSAGLIAEALPTAWERDREEGRHLLKELRQLTQGVLAEMRMLLLELRPAALIEASLGDLLRQLAEAAAAREGLSTTVTVEGKGALPPDVHIALYRIAQESLNNVVKHARANQVTIELRLVLDGSGPPAELVEGVDVGVNKAGRCRVELVVRDDGRGFDLDSVPPERLGLGIMRERAQAVGARLTIESQPGHGAQTKVVWPGNG